MKSKELQNAAPLEKGHDTSACAHDMQQSNMTKHASVGRRQHCLFCTTAALNYTSTLNKT